MSSNDKFHQEYSDSLIKSLEKTLSFVQSENAQNDLNLLIVIQSFIQQITSSLTHYFDPSIFKFVGYFFNSMYLNLFLLLKLKC